MLPQPVTVMIVEDDCIVRLGYRRVLEAAGYKVVAMTTSGREAISLVDHHRPTHVIMDVRLKGPMDGIEAAGEIQRSHPYLTIIFATALSDRNTAQRMAGVRSHAVMIKPFRPYTFVRVINTQDYPACSAIGPMTGVKASSTDSTIRPDALTSPAS